MVHFGEFFKTWSLRSNSVTREISFNRTKIGAKCQNSKNSNATFWVIFKQCGPGLLSFPRKNGFLVTIWRFVNVLSCLSFVFHVPPIPMIQFRYGLLYRIRPVQRLHSDCEMRNPMWWLDYLISYTFVMIHLETFRSVYWDALWSMI